MSVHYHVHKSPPFFPVLRKITKSTPSHPSSLTSTLTLSSRLNPDIPIGHLLAGLLTKTMYEFLNAAMRASCRTHLIILDSINIAIFSEEYKWYTSNCATFSSFMQHLLKNISFENLKITTCNVIDRSVNGKSHTTTNDEEEDDDDSKETFAWVHLQKRYVDYYFQTSVFLDQFTCNWHLQIKAWSLPEQDSVSIPHKLTCKECCTKVQNSSLSQQGSRLFLHFNYSFRIIQIKP